MHLTPSRQRLFAAQLVNQHALRSATDPSNRMGRHVFNPRAECALARRGKRVLREIHPPGEHDEGAQQRRSMFTYQRRYRTV